MAQVELATYQVSRRSVPWMLAAVVAALLPHATHLPAWLLAVCALCIGWRYGVHRGRVSYPPRRLQTLFAILLMAAVLLQYRTLAGHQAGTAMLVAMFTLKLLEMYRERDAYVVILIGYFVAAMAFLFHFTMWMAFYVIVVSVLFTATLVAINSSLETPRMEPLRRAVVMTLQSVPVAVLLFVVLPRLGPLWATGLKASDATTGISDVMSPGSVGKLARSSELAFRVDFEGPVPPVSRLYWRGLTLAEFDGTSWRQTPAIEREDWMTWYPGARRPAWVARIDAAVAAAPAAAISRYTVVMQPTQQRWLFALTMPQSMQRDTGLVFDHRLRVREPVKALYRYQVTSVAGLARDVEAPSWFLDYNRRLPANSNPKARDWALLQRAGAGSDEAYSRRVLALFRDGGYAYTLNPPQLGANAVDDFLFGTRRGFCEHYASTYVFLMRAAGIPARIVTGYQGGESNQVGGTLQVRQYDAHAWAEFWLPGRGWLEVDPTAVVAPERIAEGSRAALGIDAETFGFATGSLLGESLRTLGETLDYLNHGWNRWVLGFDDKAQQGFLKRWLGNLSPYRIGMMVLAVGVGVIGLLSLWMFRDTLFGRTDPVAREYQRFCRAWAARGHARGENEGPWDYLARLQQADASRATDVQRFVVQYVSLTYAGKRVDSDALRRLRAARAAAV